MIPHTKKKEFKKIARAYCSSDKKIHQTEGTFFKTFFLKNKRTTYGTWQFFKHTNTFIKKTIDTQLYPIFCGLKAEEGILLVQVSE